ncbi:MAG: hypothetical protein U1F56_16110 [Rubrivivax sp.]
MAAWWPQNAEGPSFAPSPLTWQVTDAMSILDSVELDQRGARGSRWRRIPGSRACAHRATPEYNADRTADLAGERAAADRQWRVLPAGMLTVKNSPTILFADITGDGLIDLPISMPGPDDPPFPGSKIGVGLNLGGGSFEIVSRANPARPAGDPLVRDCCGRHRR